MNVFRNVEGEEKTWQTQELRCSGAKAIPRMKHKIPFQDKGIKLLFATLHQKDSEPLCPSTVQ
jgi:hypothetical protein